MCSTGVPLQNVAKENVWLALLDEQLVIAGASDFFMYSSTVLYSSDSLLKQQLSVQQWSMRDDVNVPAKVLQSTGTIE